ncbi:MAG: hypothetical protein KatS3mg024_2617 [Armatimonadota bacterium]|nr:MAG: hypothetical protein KatS3mg024_2617 [Armatimonadota bacterium]
MDLQWAMPGLLAVGSLPRTREDVERLIREGIRAVLSLHPVAFLTAEAIRDAGMAHRTEEVEDFSVPSVEQMDSMREDMDAWADQRLPIYVHCYAGIGRSRTVAAAWLSLRQDSLEEAFERVGLPQTARQKQFVEEYFRLRRGAHHQGSAGDRGAGA